MNMVKLHFQPFGVVKVIHTVAADGNYYTLVTKGQDVDPVRALTIAVVAMINDLEAVRKQKATYEDILKQRGEALG